MFCPQCGTESQSTQYCRVCGANLKVIGKAVALSEAVARSDRGPLPRIKEMVKGLKVDHVSEEVSGALDRMNQEIASLSPQPRGTRPFISFGKKKTPAEKREAHISKGVVSFFSGIGLTVFLYYLSMVLVFRLPPDVIAQIPFEIDSVARIIWLLGLLPVTSGVGHIIAGLLIRPEQQQPRQLDQVVSPPRALADTTLAKPVPSVTDHTTNLLEEERIKSQRN